METGRLYTPPSEASAEWYRAHALLPQGTLVTMVTRLPSLRFRVPGAWPLSHVNRVYGFNVWEDGRGHGWVSLADPRVFAGLEARVMAHLPTVGYGPPQGEVWGVLGPARTPGSLLLARPRYGGGTQRRVVRAAELRRWGVWEPPAWARTVAGEQALALALLQVQAQCAARVVDTLQGRGR